MISYYNQFHNVLMCNSPSLVIIYVNGVPDNAQDYNLFIILSTSLSGGLVQGTIIQNPSYGSSSLYCEQWAYYTSNTFRSPELGIFPTTTTAHQSYSTSMPRIQQFIQLVSAPYGYCRLPNRDIGKTRSYRAPPHIQQNHHHHNVCSLFSKTRICYSR